MAVFKAEDVIQSVADALQYISYYHPPDYIANLARAYELEESEAARDAMAQILSQFAHVRGGAPANLPGHWDRDGVLQSRYGRAMGR